MAEKDSLFKKLKDKGEQKITEMTNEILNNPRFASALGKAIQTAMETKGKIDKNMQTVLGAMNVPTRDDYDRIAERINAISKTVSDLELRVEKLISRLEEASARKPVAKRGAGTKKSAKAKKAAKTKKSAKTAKTKK